MAGVWILAESRNQTFELLSAAMQLAEQLGTQVSAFIWEDAGSAPEYITRGADQVLVLPPLAADQPLESYVPVIVTEAKQQKPDIFLVAATSRGKEMAARIAASLHTGLCSGCTALRLDETSQVLVMERLVYGGAAVQTVTCPTRPQMATISPRTFAAAAPVPERKGVVKELNASSPSPVKVLERKPKVRQSGDITEARVLVCVGRGIEKETDMAIVRELAEAIGGELGCTRPIAEELHWLPEETYIGLSGQKVKPDIYLGIGISGQIQHVTGIRDSRYICAVNRDENAEIFGISDYGIVGDLYTVLPQLTQELKRALKK